MADQKLSELPALGVAPAETDEVYLRDVSEVDEGQRKRLVMSFLRETMLAIQNLVSGTTLAETDLVLVSESNVSKKMTLPNFRNLIGNLLELKNYRETRTAPAISAGVLTLDLANGNSFDITLTENVTSLVTTGWPASGKTGFLTLFLTQDATGSRTFAWPAAIIWAGGTVPTVSSTANARDIFTLVSNDAGVTPYGMTGGQDFS